MGVIKLLSDQTIDRIAAGEVIERPASVVKELVENAIDAGSRSIHTAVQGGGKNLISVRDDGSGMDREDVAMAFERHATSKIQDFQDFKALNTLGFRGEALASIASVSRLRLTSSLKEAEAGAEIRIEGGKIKSLKDAPPVQGTIVEIKNLFYNTPARRKDLKGPEIEIRHISDVVAAYAFAFPEIFFSLSHNGRKTIQAPPVGDIRDRIFQLYGERETDHLLPVQLQHGGIRVDGYISDHTVSRSSRSRYFVFVNQRFVQDPLIDRAVRDAYAGILKERKYPSLFLYLSLSPADVDFNVHPAKKRVRFHSAPWLFRFLRDGIRHCYARHAPVPSMISSIPPENGVPGQVRTGKESIPAEDPDVLPGLSYAERQYHSGPESTYKTGGHFEKAAFHVEEAAGMMAGGMKLIGQYRNCYLIAESPEGLLLIDQHVAHERILYEQIQRAFKKGSVESQMLLEPVMVPTRPFLSEITEARLDDFRRLGFEVELFGQDMLRIASHPAVLNAGDVRPAVSEMLDLLTAEDMEEKSSRIADRMMIRIACHAAVKANQSLTIEKMRYLTDSLFKTTEPFFCPHGRPIIFVLKHDFIQKKFKRS